MREVEKEIVQVKVEDHCAKYVNYKGDSLLEIGIPLAQELQSFYQRNYSVRDFVLQNSLRRIKELAQEGNDVGSLLDDVIELLGKEYTDKHE